MGRSISIYSSDTIDEGSFAKFVAEAGGVLGDDDAAFERPDGTVWIYGARAALRGDFESPYCACAGDPGCDCDLEQERRLDEKLGGRVSVAFYLRLAREPGSAAIALELARHFAERWRAVVGCVAYDVFPAEVFDTLLETQRMATALCSELILVLPTVPDFRAPLKRAMASCWIRATRLGPPRRQSSLGILIFKRRPLKGSSTAGAPTYGLCPSSYPRHSALGSYTNA